jgi:AraC-like DNA-binding protein
MLTQKFTLSISDILCLSIAFQAATFVVITLFSRNWLRLCNQALAALCLIFSLHFLNIFFLRAFEDTAIDNFGVFFGLLYGPLLLTYTDLLIFRNRPYTYKYLFHFLPAIFGIPFGLYEESLSSPFLNFSGLVVVLHIGFYLALAYRRIKWFQGKILETQSAIENINLGWLRTLILAVLILTLLAGIENIVQLYLSPKTDEWVQVVIFIFASYLINGLYSKGINYPEIYLGIEWIASEKSTETVIEGPTDEEELQIHNNKLRLLAFMEAEKPYLKFDITLEELAKKLDITPKMLSQLLNQYVGQNFFQFINKYRIDTAIAKMSSNPTMQIKEVMLDSGFSSKSSFNETFKRLTGLTPSEFKSGLNKTRPNS